MTLNLPLLTGRLVCHPCGTDYWSSSPTMGPDLVLHVWCPYCRREHHFEWPAPPFPLDWVAVVETSCDVMHPGQGFPDRMFVAIDPTPKGRGKARRAVKKYIKYAVPNEITEKLFYEGDEFLIRV